jgi:TonB family protein
MQFLPVMDPRSFSFPVLFASFIVLCILISMSTNWMQNEAPVILVPKSIMAQLVHIDKPKAKTVKKPVKKIVKKKISRKAKTSAHKPRVNKKPDKALPIEKPKPKAIKKPLPLPGADLTQSLEEEDQRNKLREILDQELQARQAQEDQEAVASYAGQIKSLIQSVWRFPPSAQHDQVVLLRIFMVPTGEVTEVQIVESSGNGALDRSAEQAVWKVTKFPVPKDTVLFERQFRKFLIKLKPENARL